MQRESADRKPSAALLEAKKRARENKVNEKMVESSPLKDIYSNVSKKIISENSIEATFFVSFNSKARL